jgi:hypothetical protein
MVNTLLKYNPACQSQRPKRGARKLRCGAALHEEKKFNLVLLKSQVKLKLYWERQPFPNMPSRGKAVVSIISEEEYRKALAMHFPRTKFTKLSL